MVAYQRYTKYKLGCKLSSLSVKCGNYEVVGATSCVPVDITVPDFSKVELEIQKLETQLAKTKAIVEKDEAKAEAT
jgi:hypothetical protein